MVLNIRDYEFAKQWLKQSGYNLYIGDKQILPFSKLDDEIYSIEPINTRVKVGQAITETTKLRGISNYQDLKKQGYAIVSQPVSSSTSGRGWKGQRVYYILVPVEQVPPGMDIGTIPDSHKVQLNPANGAIRLIGINAGPEGIGEWVGSRENKEEEQKEDPFLPGIFDDYKYRRVNYQAIIDRIRGIESEVAEEYVEIPEIPVLISEETGEIVCIPEGADEWVISIVGGRGSGKSFLTNSITGRVYWKWHKNIGLLNDNLNQFSSWAQPQDNKEFLKTFKKIGEIALPLPIVNVYPSTSTLTPDDIFGGEGNISFKMTFPFKEAVQDYKNFFQGNKEWKLGQSALLLRNMVFSGVFDNLNNYEELMYAVADYELDEYLAKKFNVPGNSKMKIIGIMEDLFNQKILDIDVKIPSKWTIENAMTKEKRQYYPITALMAARLVPVLKTFNLESQFYFSQYMKFILDDIFFTQTNDPYYMTNKIVTWIVIDEITTISATTNKTVAAESLVRNVTQGRPKRIGCIYNTQNYGVIDKRIRANTQFCFVLRMNYEEDAKLVAADFDLNKDKKNDMLNLEKHEVLAMTNQYFVCYDKKGRRRVSDPKETFRGMTIPPLNQHTAPSKKPVPGEKK